MTGWWRALLRRPGQVVALPAEVAATGHADGTTARETGQRAAGPVTGETLRLLREALHDSVTGLPEPALLLDRLEVALVRSRRSGAGMALLVVHVEDTPGLRARLAESTEDVLRQVAHRLRATLRESDTAARYGDGDFAVLCEDLHRNEDLALVAGRIASALDPAYSVAGAPVAVRASLHLVMPETGSTAVSLVDEMDAALRDASARD